MFQGIPWWQGGVARNMPEQRLMEKIAKVLSPGNFSMGVCVCGGGMEGLPQQAWNQES